MKTFTSKIDEVNYIKHLVNEVDRIAESMADGIKTFKSYSTDYDLDDYLIIVEPGRNPYGSDYEIIITDWSTNEIFATIPIWNCGDLENQVKYLILKNQIKDLIFNEIVDYEFQ